MAQTWWVNPDELDDAQKRIIRLPPEGRYSIQGPPGSGKTNLLLLRANYLYLKGFRDILILVFTRSLRDFIALGGSTYDFPMDKVLTSTGWALSVLYDLDVELRLERDFQKMRRQLFSELSTRIDDLPEYDAVLLDEGQDYVPEEIELFSRLAPKLMIASDSKQKIYKGEDPVNAIRSVVDESIVLEHHYRNGLKICAVADSIGSAWRDFRPLVETCNYDESEYPSTTERVAAPNLEAQITEMVSRLDTQLAAYPGEMIGVITPRNEEIDAILEGLRQAGHGALCAVHRAGEHTDFHENTRICVTTLHGAKGLEFRTLHVLAAEYSKRFSNQRRLMFTAVTRCKTSLSVYHSEPLPGYLEKALDVNEPTPPDPDLDDVFGSEK